MLVHVPLHMLVIFYLSILRVGDPCLSPPPVGYNFHIDVDFRSNHILVSDGYCSSLPEGQLLLDNIKRALFLSLATNIVDLCY
ncbi:hypothetical protein WN944_010806 [Citrus x changshan-huyou]|uniref:Secreted protein n=1 Tax=Citrus x changshan-huyou TaxID=2935761 RepID=A0AAP0QY69_9ROSI